jgi:hypothetical protein
VKLVRLFKDDCGWTSFLRLEPGTVVAKHRHTGETQVVTLEGQRRLEGGAVIGPGGNVYEPTGNVDTWSAVGDVPLVVYGTVFGAVEPSTRRATSPRASPPRARSRPTANTAPRPASRTSIWSFDQLARKKQRGMSIRRAAVRRWGKKRR